VILGKLRPLVEEQGKSMVLLGHSSGGWVATQTALKKLHAKRRAERKLTGVIIGIFYLDALVIPVGESIHSYFQPKYGTTVVPPFMTFHVSQTMSLISLPLTTMIRNTAQKVSGRW
jgi:pimeloyl-ACP methyl ester carboxylesterase